MTWIRFKHVIVLEPGATSSVVTATSSLCEKNGIDGRGTKLRICCSCSDSQSRRKDENGIHENGIQQEIMRAATILAMSGIRALAYPRKAPSATTIPKTAGAARRSVLRRHEPKETVVSFGKFSWFLDTMCQWHVAQSIQRHP
jgi:hypothetical protein